MRFIETEKVNRRFTETEKGRMGMGCIGVLIVFVLLILSIPIWIIAIDLWMTIPCVPM